MPRESHFAPPSTPLSSLLQAWLDGEVTTLETGRRIDRRHRIDFEESPTTRAVLVDLFPPYRAADPAPAAVRLLMRALTCDDLESDALVAIARRRDLLQAVLVLDPDSAVIDVILRPGERVMLGTSGGRKALVAILAGDPEPFLAWLQRTMLDPNAFASTTSDVPLHDLQNLRELITLLASATESLAPGASRVMVADEWVAETTVAALADDVPFAEVARAIGETLLTHTSPILLWHAAHELAVVAEDDPDLRDAVLSRCLTVGTSEAGRCPAEAAAPLLGELGTHAAEQTLNALAPRLDGPAWQAISKTFLRRELATCWHNWREPVQRWASEDNPERALAVLDALLRAPAPEIGAVAWFTESDARRVRTVCRSRLGLAE